MDPDKETTFIKFEQTQKIKYFQPFLAELELTQPLAR